MLLRKTVWNAIFLPSFTWYKTCDISLKIHTYTSVTQNQTIQTHKYLIASNYGRSCLVASGNSIITKQVDILISKSQTLQHYTLNIMYIKLHKIIMDKKPTKSMKIWSSGNEQIYLTLQIVTTQYNINIPYNWPAFLAVKNG